MNTFPTIADEEVDNGITLDEYVIRNKNATYLLTMDGDSMAAAGILAGDLVVVERGPSPKPGSLIVVELDGAWAIRHFDKNSKEELRVSAVVRGIVRKYK